MRKLQVACMFFFSVLFVKAAAQNPLDIRVRIAVEQVPLEEALYALIDEGAPLSFSNRILPSDYLVSLSANDIRLEDALRFVLAGTDLFFEVRGGVVVIKQREEVPEFIVYGYVRDAESGEPLVGAVVYDSLLRRGSTTNAYGFYSLRLPKGKRRIRASYLGYHAHAFSLALEKNTVWSVNLVPSLLLQTIVVQDSFFRPFAKYGAEEDLNRPDLKALPALGGENDLFRLLYLQPGVQTGADGFGGMSVHGGGVDQNLVLLDGVPVYNPTHMVGLFSVFDDRVVRSARFWGHVFPARYGERASSVLDVRTREGNKHAFRTRAYLALTSAGLLCEGPVKKEQSSFFVSLRRSLLDIYQSLYNGGVGTSEVGGISNRGRYYFYDFTAKFNTRLGGRRNRLFLSYYRGIDYFRNESFFDEAEGDTVSSQYLRDLAIWGNSIAVLRINREINERLFINLTGTFSRFFFDAENQFNFERLINGLTNQRINFLGGYSSNNRDWALKLNADFALSPNHYLRYGSAVTWHQFQPGAIFIDQFVQVDTFGFSSENLLPKIPQRTQEVVFYLEDEFQWRGGWQGNLGFRHNILLLKNYTYFALQPRFFLSNHRAGRHLESTFYLAWGRFFQPLHLLSSSGIGLPRDLWVSATRRVAPIDSWAGHLGWKGFWRQQLQVDVKVYYKHMKHLLVFNQGVSTSIDAENWQNHVLRGDGWAYGVDAMLRWERPRWVVGANYSLGKAERRFEDVNRGNPYPYRYDRRHNLNLYFIYKLKRDWTFSAQWIWRSGMAVNLPRQLYAYNQLNLLYSNFPPQFPFVVEVPVGEKQNDFRMPPYHRLDVSGIWEPENGGKIQSIAFGVYNAYVRKNPLYYFIQRRPDASGTLRSKYYRFVLLPIMPYLKISWAF